MQGHEETNPHLAKFKATYDEANSDDDEHFDPEEKKPRNPHMPDNG